MLNRGGNENTPVHVINIEIKDEIDTAIKGGEIILKLAKEIEEKYERIFDEIPQILERIKEANGEIVSYTVTFY